MKSILDSIATIVWCFAWVILFRLAMLGIFILSANENIGLDKSLMLSLLALIFAILGAWAMYMVLLRQINPKIYLILFFGLIWFVSGFFTIYRIDEPRPWGQFFIGELAGIIIIIFLNRKKISLTL